MVANTNVEGRWCDRDDEVKGVRVVPTIRSGWSGVSTNSPSLFSPCFRHATKSRGVKISDRVKTSKAR